MALHIRRRKPTCASTSDKDLAIDAVELQKGTPANRRDAERTREARRILMLARQAAPLEVESSQPELKHPAGYRILYSTSEMEDKLEWAAGLTSDASSVVKKGLERQKKLGSFRRVAQAPEPVLLATLDQDFPNFAEATDAIRKRLHLCRLAPEKLLKLPPILLDGPPGIGKTAYCLRLSELFQIRFEVIDVSKAGADFSMIGLDAGYSTGRPGRIWESLSYESMSVMWMLDEVDKKSESVRDASVNYLLGLLEPATAKRFIDNAMQLAIDASYICYVATSNDKSQISGPLLTRFMVFDIAAPTTAQARAIVMSIYRELHRNEDWASAFADKLSDEIIDALVSFTPREIHKRLYDAHATAASLGRTVLHVSDISTKTEADNREGRSIGFL